MAFDLRVILTKRATRAAGRISDSGAQAPPVPVLHSLHSNKKCRRARDDISNGALRDLETGTGFAAAKLSEILPAARVARFVRMTEGLALLASRMKQEEMSAVPSARDITDSSAGFCGVLHTSKGCSPGAGRVSWSKFGFPARRLRMMSYRLFGVSRTAW